MRAIRVHEQGGVDKLVFDEVPDPVAGPGQVVVDVFACGVNHLDIWQRAGQPGRTPVLPLTPGADICGVVSSLGDGVDSAWMSKRVSVYPGLGTDRRAPWHADDESFSVGFGVIAGGYAQKVAVPAHNLVAIPDEIGWVMGAAFPVTFTTALHMLVTRATIRPEMTVLVHGAGAGVGNAALQIARMIGCRVIATAGSDDKLARAREMGADTVINYRTGDFVAETLAATDGRGVDIVVDHIGGDTTLGSLRALAVGGTLVNCGVTAGNEITIDLRAIYPRQLSIVGSMLGSRAEMETVAGFIARGDLKPVVQEAIPWGEVRRAHELMESRDLFGKLVLLMD